MRLASAHHHDHGVGEEELTQLREAGIPAHGLVLETDPESAVKDAFGMLDPAPTDIIVSTHPLQKSGWLRKNVVDMIITDLCVFHRPDHDSPFKLIELAPGVAADEVRQKSSAQYVE